MIQSKFMGEQFSFNRKNIIFYWVLFKKASEESIFFDLLFNF